MEINENLFDEALEAEELETAIEFDFSNFVDSALEAAEEEFTIDFVEQIDIDGDPFFLQQLKLYDEILQYLSAKDILNLSEVSKFWYKLTGFSVVSMDKIKLVIDESHTRGRIPNVIKHSIRHYKHLDIKALFDNKDETAEFIHRQAESLVTIRTRYDIELPMPICFLRNVKEIFFIAKDMDKSKIMLYENGLLAAASNVENLTIWGNFLSSDQLTFGRQVNDCASLKKLVLEYGAGLTGLLELSKFEGRFGFNLEKFYCDTINESYIQHQAFIHFIGKQQQSLKDLKVKGTYDLVKEALQMLMYLERLTFSPLPSVDHFNNYSLTRMSKHENLKEINLIFLSINTSNILNFVNVAPNLETIYVSYLNRDVIKLISLYGEKVKSLKFACSFDNDLNGLQDFYRIMNMNLNNNRRQIEISQI